MVNVNMMIGAVIALIFVYLLFWMWFNAIPKGKRKNKRG